MFKQWLPTLRKSSEEALRPVSIASLMEDFWRNPFGNAPLSESFPRSLFAGLEAYPVVNVSESEKEITVDAELPGLEVKDVDVSLQNGSLLITGEKKFEGEEKKDSYHRIERSYGKFTRAVPLPAKVNPTGVTARFEKGVLHVTLPKAEPSEPVQKINIEG